MSRGRRSSLPNGFFGSSSINDDHPYEEEFNFETPSHPQANRGGLSSFFSSSSSSPPLPNAWGLQANADSSDRSSVPPPNPPTNKQISSPPRSEQPKIRNIALQSSSPAVAAAVSTPPSDRKTHENDQRVIIRSSPDSGSFHSSSDPTASISLGQGNDGDGSSLQDNDKAETEQGGQYIPELFERFAENFNTALTETFKQFEQFSDSTAERHEIVESMYKRAEAEISLLKKRKREAQNAVEKFRFVTALKINYWSCCFVVKVIASIGCLE